MDKAQEGIMRLLTHTALTSNIVQVFRVDEEEIGAQVTSNTGKIFFTTGREMHANVTQAVAHLAEVYFGEEAGTYWDVDD